MGFQIFISFIHLSYRILWFKILFILVHYQMIHGMDGKLDGWMGGKEEGGNRMHEGMEYATTSVDE